jgi:hypothetical protein
MAAHSCTAVVDAGLLIGGSSALWKALHKAEVLRYVVRQVSVAEQSLSWQL